MNNRFIYKLTSHYLPKTIGNKAIHLRRLLDLGVQVPETYICNWDAYCEYLIQGEGVLKPLSQELSKVINLDVSYAVRSSANVEDTHDNSYAGQFTSTLNVRGMDELINAVRLVWESSESDVLRAYQEKSSGNVVDLKMAVIIQRMVFPVLSGVVFSRNPVTGMDEIVIEAVKGLGTALMQDGITPLRWVNKWNDWLEKPSSHPEYFPIAQQVVKQVQRIKGEYGKDVDLEWVYNGEQIYWVQLREITTLEDLQIYSNKISKEFLPGMIKPLVWSVNIPLVNGAWVDLISEVIGKNDIDPRRMARSFYYRAYFNTSTFAQIFDRFGMPRQSLEINMGIVDPPEERPPFKPSGKMILLVPRLFWFLVDKWRFAQKVDKYFPEIETQFQDIASQDVSKQNPGNLLEQIDRLYTIASGAAYYNIVVPLLMSVYTGFLRRLLKNIGVSFDELDLNSDIPSLEAYDPNVHIKRLNQEFNHLESRLQEDIRRADYASFQMIKGIDHFRVGVQEFIDQFGHLSDSGNDFSVSPWRENPDLILRLILDYHRVESQQGQKLRFQDIPQSFLRRYMLKVIYDRALKFRYYRERVSSIYTYGYGLFREYYMALGDQLVERRCLDRSFDIFYLYDREVRQLLENDTPELNVSELVKLRKHEMDSYRDIELPEIVYGDQAPPIIQNESEQLRGTPTSGGVYTGRAKVIQGIHDFSKLEDGNVLVIPYSDVGWTPLFARAGAVVAESGGMLSHSSIVAREYGIPAVVSVPGACKIQDDFLVTVDGYRGVVMVQSV